MAPFDWIGIDRKQLRRMAHLYRATLSPMLLTVFTYTCTASTIQQLWKKVDFWSSCREELAFKRLTQTSKSVTSCLPALDLYQHTCLRISEGSANCFKSICSDFEILYSECFIILLLFFSGYIITFIDMMRAFCSKASHVVIWMGCFHTIYEAIMAAGNVLLSPVFHTLDSRRAWELLLPQEECANLKVIRVTDSSLSRWCDSILPPRWGKPLFQCTTGKGLQYWAGMQHITFARSALKVQLQGSEIGRWNHIINNSKTLKC